MMVSNLSKNNSKESVVSLLQWIYKFIFKKNKIKLLKLLILMLICGFSEIVSISSVIPFLNMLTDPEKVNNYKFLMNIMTFTNYYRPIAISGFLLIFANVINLFLRLVNIKKINEVTWQLGNELSFNLFGNIINQPFKYHLNLNSSVIINAVAQDVQKTIFVLSEVNQLITGFIISSFIVLTLFIIDFRVAFISLIVFGITYIFVGKRAKAALKRYLQSDINVIQRTFLFNTQKSKQFSPNTAVRLLKRLYEQVGIRNATSHSGRRSYITKLANSGVNVRVIAELASHKSIQTTQRYIDINDNLCSKAVELV